MHLLTARYATIWLFWLMGAGISFAQNPYYDHGTFPATGTLGTSAGMRAELDSIEAGFAKLPTLSGNADKTVRVNAAGTALVASDSPVMSGAAFPASPSVNALFLVTDDSVAGACDSDAGTEVTLCRWDGSAWVPIVGATSVPGLSSVLAIDRIDGDATNQASAFRVGSAAANAYMVTYYDSTDGLIHTCLVGGVLDDCNKRIKLLTGKKYFIANSAGTEIFTVSETGAITNATLDGSGAGNTIVLYQKICGGDVAAINPSDGTAQHVWNKDPLSTAPTLTAASGTNRGTAFLTFPDSDGDYGVQLSCEMPVLTGNVDVVIWWNTTGTGNARFQVATKFYADDAADDASFNTASVVTAAAGTSGRPNRQVLSGLTMTGYAANSLGRFRFFRNRTEASDSLTAALNVEKVEIWGHVNY